MTTIGSFDAKTHLPKLLDRVAHGETIEITKRGVPIAKLTPISSTDKRDPKEAAREIRELRRGITLGHLKLRDLIHEGRP